MRLATAIFITVLSARSLNYSSASQVQIECIAGCGDGDLRSPARSAKLIEPFGVAFDTAGNAYICEYKGQRISRITPEGLITLFAGTGKMSYSGDGGPALEASFNDPHGLVIGRDQQIYVADTRNHCVRKIDLRSGTITTIAGTGEAGYSGDGGPAIKATFNGIYGIDINGAGDKVYLADLENRRVRTVDIKSGIVTTIAGNGDTGIPQNGADAAKAPLVDPRAVAVDSKGSVYILERRGNSVRVVDTYGKIRTVIGPATSDNPPNSGSRPEKELNGPKHLCIDLNDNVIIADAENHLIRRYTPKDGKTIVIAGTGERGSRIVPDDPLKTHLNRPHGVSVHPSGALFISDSYNHRVLKLSPKSDQENRADHHRDQVEQLEKYLDRELEQADQGRAKKWHRDFSSIENYKASLLANRRRLIETFGGVPSGKSSLDPRRERVGETTAFATDRIWLHTSIGIEIYGIMLTPHKIPKPGAPALICLHGMGSSPEQVCGMSPEEDYTRRFGARAAEQGYVVFAPWMTNDVRTKSRLDRKAILAGTRLQGLEQEKMIRVIDYLQTLPIVDPKRIGIYGISWGGRTAMYTAAMDERIAATVISGHFNETLPKMVTSSPHYTAYIETAEDYAFFSGLAREFSDSDVGSLIAPRPIFIEQGTKDRVVHYLMAQAEFARLQEIYKRLGVGDRVEFGLFDGGHVVYGEEAFKFLRRWLIR